MKYIKFSVTEEEIQKWYDDFSSDCPTGKLQKTEFTKIYKQLFPNGNPTAFAWLTKLFK